MFRLTTLSIRSLLLLIIFVVALPAAGIIIYSGLQFRNELLHDARIDTLKLTERIASEQLNLIAGGQQLMMALAQLPDVKNRDEAKVEAILRGLLKLNPMYANIFIADGRGMVWASAFPAKKPYSVADRRYFINALATGRLSSGEYVVGRVTAKPSFNLAYPVKDERGAIVNVISVSFALDEYHQLLERMHLPPRSSFLLLDHRGIIMYRALDPQRYLGKPYPPKEFRRIKNGPDVGSRVRPGLEGDKRIISYRKLRLEGEQTPFMYVTAGIVLEAATAEASRSLTYSMILLMSFLLLGCFAALWIGKRAIVDRFQVLEDASQRVADGDLQVRVAEMVGGGEIGKLGKRFDAMAGDLAMREEERSKAEAERDELIAMLANANEELEAFNYTVAHDLRQPLNLLSSYCQVIEQLCGQQLREECKGYVRDIHNTTLRMNGLIEALLGFARMGQVELYRQTVDLSMMAKEIARSRQYAEPERQVEFRIEDGIVADADSNLLRVVLENLIGNAWKYTREREVAVIEFGVKEVGGVPAYFVRDNGPGFSMEDAARIFTPFQRLPATEKFKGFGIGLATVDRIIRRHGGKVWAEGEPDQGASFYFTLPSP